MSTDEQRKPADTDILSAPDFANKLAQTGANLAEDAQHIVHGAAEEVIKAELHTGKPTVTARELQKITDQIARESAELHSRLDRKKAPYVMPKEIAMQIEAAIALGKPVLVAGEPGTGKTALAWAIAGEKNLELIIGQCEVGVDDPRDLLYTYDQIRRMSDAFAQQLKPDSEYVKPGPIGQALKAGAEGRQVVLLLDEVDKTEAGFEDRFLSTLENLSYTVAETGEKIQARVPPIIFMTSNNKRDFTDTFRRRFMLIHIPFPNPDQMSQIVLSHFPDTPNQLVDSAIRRFYEIRNTPGIEHRPSTAELLDWVTLLKMKGVSDVDGELVHVQALLKTAKDQERLGANKSRDHLLQEYGMPPHIINAVNGEVVFKINVSGAKKSELYTMLANQGISFQSEKGVSYQSDYKPFRIAGTTPIADGWLVGDVNLYQQLLNEGFITETVVVEPAGDFRFKTAEDGNELYSYGKDTQDRQVYRMIDGRIAYIKKIPDTTTQSR